MKAPWIESDRELVLLQYGEAGERTSGYSTVHSSEAGKWVALDSNSGGYPYATEIANAHDFGSVEKAQDYARHFPGFKVRCVLVTYKVVA